MQLSLYLHFPFCKQKCLYCDFVSAPCSRETISSYCNALCREIRMEAAHYRDAEITTVFFGGGTPSLVPVEEMEKVLNTLHESFQWKKDAEFTSEANPGTLHPEWLSLMREHGLNRLSLGIQSAQNRLLREIGRIHTAEEAEQAVRMAQGMGIANVNVDLMFGLPGQSLQEYLDSIQMAAELDVRHISAYSLILEEGTPLYRLVKEGKSKLPSEDEVSDMQDVGMDRLESLGYQRYEISNYAREGYRCRHNLGYWQGSWYLGLGIAAHSLLPDESGHAFWLRRANPESLSDYLRGMDSGSLASLRELQPISKREAMFETAMLSLRTTDGLSGSSFAARFGKSFFQVYPEAVDSLLRDGLAVRNGENLSLTRRGMEVQNLVSLRFMDA